MRNRAKCPLCGCLASLYLARDGSGWRLDFHNDAAGSDCPAFGKAVR